MIVNNCSDDVYNLMGGFRSTFVKLAYQDARKFQAEVLPSHRDNALRPAEKKSDALTFGTIVHERILLKKRPLYCPHNDKRTKEYKAWIASMVSTSSTETSGEDCSESQPQQIDKCESDSETDGEKGQSSKARSVGSIQSARKRSKSR